MRTRRRAEGWAFFGLRYQDSQGFTSRHWRPRARGRRGRKGSTETAWAAAGCGTRSMGRGGERFERPPSCAALAGWTARLRGVGGGLYASISVRALAKPLSVRLFRIASTPVTSNAG